MQPSFLGWITACIAHYDCRRYVRRAVDSLLSQSYPWIRVIVINDGDPSPPWDQLASVRDRRLHCFNIPINRGCFFCWELARRATSDEYFMMQDADDWAAPNRAAVLVDLLTRTNSSLAVSAQPQFCETPDGRNYLAGIRWGRTTAKDTTDPFVVQTRVTEDFVYRAPHHGLIRTSTLRELGGYYGGFRVGWDTLLTNLVLMTGSISWSPQPLYYRLIRSNSLTHSDQTGTRSAYAVAVSRCLESLYQACFAEYRRFHGSEVTHLQLCSNLRGICSTYVPREDLAALRTYAYQLGGIVKCSLTG